MTLAKLHLGPNNGKRKLTTLELLLVAGFILFLAYMSLEPLVLPANASPKAQPPIASIPPAHVPAAEPSAPVPSTATAAAVAQPVAEQKSVAVAAPAQSVPVTAEKAAPAAANVIKPIFVVTPNSTVLERIAPVATVTIEEPVTSSATGEPSVVPPPVLPAAATPEAAKAVVSPAPAPVAVAVTVQAVPAAVEAPKQAAGTRVEISDATGVDGFGKNIAQSLEQSGVAVAKVASVAAGKQRRTVIVYRDGYEDAARRLGKLFAVAPALVKNAASRDIADAADVKLILGTVAAREKNLLASDVSVPKLSQERVARSH